MSTTSNKAEAAERRARMNYRVVVVPKPEILPACKNCTHLNYDSDDRQNLKGEITLRKIKLRCSVIKASVSRLCVCDEHDFYNADRSDR